MEAAIEIKSSSRVYESDVKGLRALAAEHSVKRLILVSFETEVKKLGNIECFPWEIFLQKLWAGELI